MGDAYLSNGVPIMLLHGCARQQPAASEEVPVELHRRLDQLRSGQRRHPFPQAADGKYECYVENGHSKLGLCGTLLLINDVCT